MNSLFTSKKLQPLASSKSTNKAMGTRQAFTEPALRIQPLCAWVHGLVMVLVSTAATAQSPGPGGQPGPIDFADIAQGRVIALPSLEIGDAAAPSKDASAQVLSLSQLVQQALRINPQIQQAMAQQESARAQRQIARAELHPSFTVRHALGPERSQTAATAAAAGSSNRHDYTTSTLRLTQPVYNRFLQHEHSAALEAESAAGLRTHSIRDSTIASVIRASVDVASARLILDFSDAQLGQLQNILNHLENRAAYGASSQADLERARTRALNARQIRLEQQAAYRNALFELERLTTLRPQAIELPSLAQLPPLQGVRETLLSKAYEQNADIRALERDVNAQQLRVRAELARYQPVLGVSLEQDTNRNVGGTTPRRQDSRALAVMTWALSLGGKERYQAQAASAELQQREARLRDEKLRLAQAIEADFSLLESALLRISAAQQEQAAAARVVDAVAEQLRSGRLGSLLEALDASERLFAARQRLAQAMAQTIKSHAQLLQRTGQLGTDSMLARFPAPGNPAAEAGPRR